MNEFNRDKAIEDIAVMLISITDREYSTGLGLMRCYRHFRHYQDDDLKITRDALQAILNTIPIQSER